MFYILRRTKVYWLLSNLIARSRITGILNIMLLYI